MDGVTLALPIDFEVQIDEETRQEEDLLEVYNKVVDRFPRIPKSRQNEIYADIFRNRISLDVSDQMLEQLLLTFRQKLASLSLVEIQIMRRYVDRFLTSELLRQLLIADYEIETPAERYTRDEIRLEILDSQLVVLSNNLFDMNGEQQQKIAKKLASACSRLATLYQKIEAERIPETGKDPLQQQYEQQFNADMHQLSREICMMGTADNEVGLSGGGSAATAMPPTITVQPVITSVDMYPDKSQAAIAPVMNIPALPMDKYSEARYVYLDAYDATAKDACLEVWHEQSLTPAIDSIDRVVENFDKNMDALTITHTARVEASNKSQGKQMKQVSEAQQENHELSLSCVNLARSKRKKCYEPYTSKSDDLTREMSRLRKLFDREDAAIARSFVDSANSLYASKNVSVFGASIQIGVMPSSTNKCWKATKKALELPVYDENNQGPFLRNKQGYFSAGDISMFKWVLSKVAGDTVDEFVIGNYLGPVGAGASRFKVFADFLTNDTRLQNFCSGMSVFRNKGNPTNQTNPQSAGGQINMAYDNLIMYYTQGKGCP